MVPFGYNASGIKTAARTFFGKEVADLSIEEAAVLVGMLQRPSFFNPVRHNERTRNRRNSVLNKMQEHGYLSKESCDSIKQLPLVTNFERQDHHAGTAPYFREYLRVIMTKREPERSNNPRNLQAFRDDSIQWATNPLFGWCNKNLRPDKTPYNLYTDGLKIYTTIDSRMQRYAEEVVRQHMILKQKEFFTEKKGRRKAPFSEDLTDKEIETIMNNAMRQSERYRVLNLSGMSHSDIIKNFHEPCQMTIFTWDGDKDTIMTPFDSIKHYKSHLHASMMAMNPHTGEVKAYVGGINYKHFKWDGVKGQRRQVGSTFKPIVYTLAFQDRPDLTPCYEVLNQAQSFILRDTVWSPRSSGKKEDLNKFKTLKWGLAASENNLTAWLLKQVSPHAVVEMAQKMGITSHIDPVPAICLGSAEISVAEMTAAFAVFSSGGVYTEPIFVTRIEDNNGNLLQRFIPNKEEVISEQTAYLMCNMLMGVVNGGTGSRLRHTYNLTNPIGGKTGTTQNHSDGWFIGITPDLVTGVWAGGELRSIRFSNMALGQGASMALPIYGMFMQKVYADKRINLTTGPFKRPRVFNIMLDCSDIGLGSGVGYEE